MQWERSFLHRKKFGAHRIAALFLPLLLSAAVAQSQSTSATTAPVEKKPDKADFWAFKPLRTFLPPKVAPSSWARNPVDAFVLARMQKEGFAPAAEATRRTLIRRLTFDLNGLPPRPEEVETFVQDENPNAYENLVDRLLASPRYGERWARHWLDTVHYGETHGYDKDKLRPNSWPYRDWVIRALNLDKPYPRFVEEQLAGDVLFPDDPDALVATGFLAAGPWDFVGHVELPETKTDGLIARYNDRDDMVMTTMSTFQSLTVHCARCHDHKFDPISQLDYYRLQAVFAGVDRADRIFDRDPQVFARRKILLNEKNALQAREKQLAAVREQVRSPEIDLLDAELASLKNQLKSETPEVKARQEELQKEIKKLQHQKQARAHEALEPEVRGELGEVTNRLAQIDVAIAALPPPQWVYAAASDFPPNGHFVPSKGPRPVHFLQRGDVKRPREEVAPGSLGCLPGLKPVFDLPNGAVEGQRRAALARWLTDPKNFLTRRSIVNRVWQYHFGRGLVDSPNDFGHMGSLPTHPELLDWLAQWFSDNGESIKKLHKLLVTSATYRQAAADHAAFARLDSDNRYLWRMPRKRLDAEEIRDAILAVSGKLDLSMGGPSQQHFYFKDDHSPVYDYSQFDVESAPSFRRSVYRQIVRSVPDPFMDCLDAADPFLLTPRRNTTLTALQALATLNNAFVVRQAEHWAARLQTMSPDLNGQTVAAFKLCFSRAPDPRELDQVANFAGKHGWAGACRVLFNSNEFMFVE